MASTWISLVVFIGVVQSSLSHSYHLGSCPQAEAMQNFQMNKFLGKWYVIQKTSTASRCIFYNFTVGEEPGEYHITQASEHFLLGLMSVDHSYLYTGLLTAKNPNNAADMTVRFPFSVAGSASYKVILTDYDTFAGIYTCQKLAFANRQSASILSRTPTLDKMSIDKIRATLSSIGVDPHNLSIIEQTNCKVNATENGVNINTDEETLSLGSTAEVSRKADDGIGDGIEVAADEAKKIYNHVASKEEKRISPEADAEWLP